MSVFLESLNPEQKQAAIYGGKNLLVLAGAGSGKTKTLISRLAYLCSQGIDPRSIIAVTFTNKAAKELKERLELLYPAARRAHIGTFHRISHLLLRQYGELIGLNKEFQIITPNDQKRIFKKIFEQLNRQEDDFINHKNAPAAVCSYYYHPHGALHEKWKELLEAYFVYCEKQYLVDFDALIFKATKLFEHPDYVARFSINLTHVMIDEFQDTNPSQFRWITELTRHGAHLTLVGDDDQSIYGFRGADLSLIQQIKNTMEDLHIVRLEQNYRSTPSILAAANALIAQNQHRLGKKLWTANPDGPKVQVLCAPTDQDEVSQVSQKIHHLLHQGIAHDDIAVLYRSNMLSRLLEASARKYQWPYRISGGMPFFDREEIKDALSYLSVVISPHSDLPLLRILNKPARKIGAKTQDQLEAYAHTYGISIWQSMMALLPSLTPAVGRAIGAFLHLIQGLQSQLETLPLGEFVSLMMMQTQLLAYHQAQEQGEDKEDNLHELIKALIEYGEEPSERSNLEKLQSFLGEYLLSDQEAEMGIKGLTFSTCHAAKGLEWPYVFVIGVEQGLFPHERSINNGDLEEERRLFYVALTRGKQQVVISHAKRRLKFNQFESQMKSQFLNEIPEEYLDDKSRSFVVTPNQNKPTGFPSTSTFVKKKVIHKIFGGGTVLNYDQQQDLITVDFAHYGIKALRYSLAEKLLTFAS